MRQLSKRSWREDSGLLSFEWVLLMSILSIAVVSGIAGARDAIIDELGDVSQAILSLDQSYTIHLPAEIVVNQRGKSGASNSLFVDTPALAEYPRPVDEIDPLQDGVDDANAD